MSSSSPGGTKLEVSNKGQFVILDVDGSSGLVVGMQSNLMEEGHFRETPNGSRRDSDQQGQDDCGGKVGFSFAPFYTLHKCGFLCIYSSQFVSLCVCIVSI